MADWYTEAAERLRRQECAKQIIRDHARQETILLEQEGQRLWKQLRQWLQAEVKQLNERLGREVLTATVTCRQELDIHAKLENLERDDSVVFEEATHSVSYIANNRSTLGEVKSEAWQIKLMPQETVAFCKPNSPNGACQPIEKVSSIILNGLMGWN